VEIPIAGPGSANTLVCVSGIAVSGADSQSEFLVPFEIFIKTDYRLHDADEFKGIVNSNSELLAATYATLAGIAADDSTDVAYGVDSIETTIDANRRVQIHVVASLLGDATVNEVAYQANIIIKKAR
jgi:hypothetical protein